MRGSFGVGFPFRPATHAQGPDQHRGEQNRAEHLRINTWLCAIAVCESLMGAVLAQVANETSLMLKTNLSPSQLLDSMTEYFLEHPEIARLWMFQMLQNIQLLMARAALSNASCVASASRRLRAISVETTLVMPSI